MTAIQNMINANNNTLPKDYTPSDKSVVIGKGKKFYFHPGNEWLRRVVAEKIPIYSAAQNKADKSQIISDMVAVVNQEGEFVKINADGAWIFAEPLLCREKVSQTFRDNLAQTYRSSNVAKRNKRRQEQEKEAASTGSNSTPMMPALVLSTPPAKRQRKAAPVSPVTVLDESNWFDWDMPLRDIDIIESRRSKGQPSEVSSLDSMPFDLEDFDDFDFMADNSMSVQKQDLPQHQQHQASPEKVQSMIQRRVSAFAA